MRLKNKVAIITGAGAGIGRACAEVFCEQGAKLVIAERNRDAGEAVAAALKERGSEAIFVETDVSDAESVKSAVDQTVSTYGRIDVLYNNAGGSTPNDRYVTEIAFDEFWNKMSVDLFGVWAFCRYAIPHMIDTDGGSIINATSVLGMKGFPGRDAYTAAKGGIISLTRSMAVEYAPHKIRVNAIAPGATITERVKERLANSNPGTSGAVSRSLLGTIEPREIAYAVAFLASDEAQKITGQVLAVDSGLSIC